MGTAFVKMVRDISISVWEMLKNHGVVETL
ncbi:hypothetical protein AN619_09740 [Thermotalea metallivorans]|uniref:Uncharacterized protein n=1 Tax=Thermotalea metallivorans TaxID=520762 RepID=A0A140L7B8_9FIRM|nr:hypothetical protein AN619_09740 [Thermotalea metallivorans]